MAEYSSSFYLYVRTRFIYNTKSQLVQLEHHSLVSDYQGVNFEHCHFCTRFTSLFGRGLSVPDDPSPQKIGQLL